MKKLFLFVFTLILTSNSSFSQDGMKLLKSAKSEMGKYSSNAVQNASSLEKALKMIDEAFAIPGQMTW